MFGQDDPPKRVVYCYGVYQKEFEELLEGELEGAVQLIQGLPSDVQFSADCHT